MLLATLLLIGGLYPCKINAQMSVFPGREKAEVKPVEEKPMVKEIIVPYDSLTRFYGKNYKEQVGQTLFLTDYSRGNFPKMFFEDVEGTRKYQYTEKNGVTIFPDYDKLIGKCYYVNGVFNDTDSEWENDCFELIMQEEPYDTIYYRFRVDRGGSVVNMAFATKLKETHKGNELVVRDIFDCFHSLETGGKIPPPPIGTRFTCTDVILNKDGNLEIMFLLSNPEYPPLYTSWTNIGWIIGTPEKYMADQQKKAAEEKEKKQKEAEIVKRYGKTALEDMRKGIVRIGWTMDMCYEAWGQPKKVNTTENQYGITSQWVYAGGRYLYFEKGILTSIQK